MSFDKIGYVCVRTIEAWLNDRFSFEFLGDPAHRFTYKAEADGFYGSQQDKASLRVLPEVTFPTSALRVPAVYGGPKFYQWCKDRTKSSRLTGELVGSLLNEGAQGTEPTCFLSEHTFKKLCDLEDRLIKDPDQRP